MRAPYIGSRCALMREIFAATARASGQRGTYFHFVKKRAAPSCAQNDSARVMIGVQNFDKAIRGAQAPGLALRGLLFGDAMICAKVRLCA